MTKYTFVTTTNQDGYEKYGRRMIEGFIKHFPQEVELIFFTENVTSELPKAHNVHYRNLLDIKQMVEFKEKHKNNPIANGIVVDKNGKQAVDYRRQAVRFSHTVFAFTEMKDHDTDWVIRFDADTIITKDLTIEELDKNLGKSDHLCHYLGRKDCPSRKRK